jgi:hypothetical protein
MSGEATASTGVPEKFPTARLRSFRIIPRLDTYPTVVALTQTLFGKLALLIVFGLLLYGADQHSWLMVTCLALPIFFPRRRHLAVSVATLLYTGVILSMKSAHPLREFGLVALVFALADFLVSSAASRQRTRIGRHPLLFLLGGFTSLILICCWLSPHKRLSAPLWEFTTVLGSYVWFIGYVLLDREAKPVHRFGLELGSLRPFWGAASTPTPFPNGTACLRQIEAKDTERLAITQLKGLKLLAWARLLSLFLFAYTWFFHNYLGIPFYDKALDLSARHMPLPSLICWASLILEFFHKLLAISIWGHRIIACCRMAGFDALRNTYRPLSSTTVAEFFNRYYFYYKELLVRFFFFPTYLRLPPSLGTLRTTISIFVAACFANAYYHFTRDLWFIQVEGLWGSLKSFQVFLFYCVILASAISISRVRGRPDPSKGFIRCTLVPAFLVSVFYCLLGIFSTTDRNYPLLEHLRFLAHLFFLN